jgi:NADH:ubiquinone oxidoreductase subunit F (NADH-binding)
MPRIRPPFPAEKGLWGKPTNNNNVETYANVPVIINKGAQWYSSIGTKGSKGTKIFSLVGKVANTGLVEVPMGTTLRQIVFDIGGGLRKQKEFKAVQTGGPSGGCIPERFLDLPVDFDELTKVGGMMGSGGMIVMDQDTCMVDLARYFVKFLVDESCGQCNPCREGLKQMLDVLNRICEGDGIEGDVELLEELGSMIQKFSLCGLGTSAPNPVLTTILYFRHEYDAHILHKKCPAGICKPLFHYEIDPDACTGCTLCAKKCPQDAVVGKKKETHEIIQDKCIKCGICYDGCKFDAIAIR